MFPLILTLLSQKFQNNADINTKKIKNNKINILRTYFNIQVCYILYKKNWTVILNSIKLLKINILKVVVGRKIINKKQIFKTIIRNFNYHEFIKL